MLSYLIIIIAVLLFTKWLQSRPFYWHGKGIPYEIPFPIFGSTYRSLNTALYKFWYDRYQAWSKQGGLYGFHFFGTPSLYVCNPEIIKEVCISKAECFSSHGFSINSNDVISGNIFHVDGEQWKTTRSKLTPFFTPSRIKLMSSLFENSFDKFIEKLRESSKSGRPCNIQDLSLRLSTDIIVNAAFGIEADSLADPNSYFFKLQSEMIDRSTTIKMMMAILSPWLHKKLGLTFFSGKTSKNLKKLISDIIQMRLSGQGVRDDFIQGLTDLLKEENGAEKNSKGQFFADGTERINHGMDWTLAQAVIMYVAGTETSGNTISYLLFELSKNIEVQDKVRQEIDEMMKRTNRSPTYDDIQSLPYSYMVMNETLRMYPVLSILPRRCTKSVKLRDNTVPVERGSFVMIPSYAIHHDSQYYPEPEKFIPERFDVDNPKNYPIPQPTTFLSFGTGPRTCIGMKFAQSEIMHLLVKILMNFKIRKSAIQSDIIEFENSVSLIPKNGIWVCFDPISPTI